MQQCANEANTVMSIHFQTKFQTVDVNRQDSNFHTGGEATTSLVSSATW